MNSLVWICRRVALSLVFSLFLLTNVCWSRGISPISASSAHAVRAFGNGNIPVLTFKYNNQRTGANLNEVVLNTRNVNSSQFGQLMSYPVDGQIYAQPLYMPGMTIGGKTVNLVIIATENNSVYAFDADRENGDPAPVWQVNFESANARNVSSDVQHCSDITPTIGITSTPVIDPVTNTLFVVSYLMVNGRLAYFLHALNPSTGHDLPGSPAEVHVPGTTFNSKLERQRAALLLANGQIYLAFGSFCDTIPYHGWIISYSYTGHHFNRLAAYNDTPNGTEGGIWGGASPLAADQQGYIYATVGNGTFDLNRGGRDAGDSYLKFSPNLHVLDYFTPFNQHCLYTSDGDLGSGGPLLIPGGEMIGGGKNGKVFVVSTSSMGHFNAVSNVCNHQGATNLDHIVQELSVGGGVYCVPAYWNGPGGPYVYISSSRSNTRAFRLVHGRLAGPVSQIPERIHFPGGNPVISSNGVTPGTGILWLIDSTDYLRAYDATNLKKELFSSNIGSYVKFSVPIVSNGKVFVPTANALKIYGLLSNTSANPPVFKPGELMPLKSTSLR